MGWVLHHRAPSRLLLLNHITMQLDFKIGAFYRVHQEVNEKKREQVQKKATSRGVFHAISHLHHITALFITLWFSNESRTRSSPAFVRVQSNGGFGERGAYGIKVIYKHRHMLILQKKHG